MVEWNYFVFTVEGYERDKWTFDIDSEIPLPRSQNITQQTISNPMGKQKQICQKGEQWTNFLKHNVMKINKEKKVANGGR